MGRLDGKIAVITGGARGQGAEEGRLFTAEGATVILTDVLDEEGRRTAADLQRAQYMHLDVRSEESGKRPSARLLRGTAVSMCWSTTRASITSNASS